MPAIFLDIDGTLVSFQTHRIPQSAVQALTSAHQAGASIYIATGRPLPIIDNLRQISHLIDGYVMCNGAWCLSHGHEVCLHALDTADVDTLLADARHRQYPLILATRDSMTVHGPRYPLVEDIFVQTLNIRCLHFHTPLAHVVRQPIIQAVAFVTAEQQEEIQPLLHHCSLNRWHPQFVDITCRNTDKAQGLRDIARHEHIPITHTVAIGDGGNDIPMLRAAATAIAMGNASPQVKQAADHVTTSVDSDGLAQAIHRIMDGTWTGKTKK